MEQPFPYATTNPADADALRALGCKCSVHYEPIADSAIDAEMEGDDERLRNERDEAQNSLRTIGWYEALDKGLIIQEVEDVLIATPAQVAVMQAEIIAAHDALREVLCLARGILYPRPTRIKPLTYDDAMDAFNRIYEAASKALTDDA